MFLYPLSKNCLDLISSIYTCELNFLVNLMYVAHYI